MVSGLPYCQCFCYGIHVIYYKGPFTTVNILVLIKVAVILRPSGISVDT